MVLGVPFLKTSATSTLKKPTADIPTKIAAKQLEPAPASVK
jgi:hypothetical protein